MQQNNENPNQLAALFVKEEVKDIEEALSGARDIIAEWVNENSIARQAHLPLFPAPPQPNASRPAPS